MKMLLIAGGWSPEREISLIGATHLAETLKKMGHAVTLLDLELQFDELLPIAAQHDFAFINLHGSPGEDGLVQAMLERIGCPYQGSGPAGSFLALNKAAAKQVLRFNGLPTPDWLLVTRQPDENWRCPFPFPVFAKSNTGGSSLRLGRAADMRELREILASILAAGDVALIEPQLVGRDATCGVLGAQALPPVLIEPVAGDYFDYASKYQGGGARELCPAPLPQDVTGQIQQLALKAHECLGLGGVSRTDFILQESGKLSILEVNTLPGMTSTSLVRREAASIGLSFEDLLARLIELGMQAHAMPPGC